MSDPNRAGYPEHDDYTRTAEETDAALQELIPDNSFKGLSPEDAATLQEWGNEARTAHEAARAMAGHSAMRETITVEAPPSHEDKILVSVGNTIVSADELSRAAPAGQNLAEGPYKTNRR